MSSDPINPTHLLLTDLAEVVAESADALDRVTPRRYMTTETNTPRTDAVEIRMALSDPMKGPAELVHWVPASLARDLERELAEAKRALSDGKRHHEEAERQLRTWQDRHAEESDIVDRVWMALGINRYEDTGGKAIDELVAENVRYAEAVSLALVAIVKAYDHHQDNIAAGLGLVSAAKLCDAIDAVRPLMLRAESVPEISQIRVRVDACENDGVVVTLLPSGASAVFLPSCDLARQVSAMLPKTENEKRQSVGSEGGPMAPSSNGAGGSKHSVATDAGPVTGTCLGIRPLTFNDGLHAALVVIAENRAQAQAEHDRLCTEGEDELAEQTESALAMADYIEDEIRALPGFNGLSQANVKEAGHE